MVYRILLFMGLAGSAAMTGCGNPTAELPALGLRTSQAADSYISLITKA